MNDIVVINLPDTAVGERLDRAVAGRLPDMSRTQIQSLIKGGRVHDDKHRARTDPSARIAAPMSVSLHLPPPIPCQAAAEDIPLTIAYEDDHIIVIDKPSGLTVHPAFGNQSGTLVNALLHHCHGKLSSIGGSMRPGIVHRIDKDTSGLIVVAKDDRSHAGLAKQFAAHSIERSYRAIVAGRPTPPAQTISAPIGRSPSNRKKMAVVGRGKHAVTHFQTRARLGDATLIECRLETGRTHQIRVHMAHIGHAIVGDPAYGRLRRPHAQSLSSLLKAQNFARQALHAARLGFIHPISGREMLFESALPCDMEQLIEALQQQSKESERKTS